jgi:ABC-type antimicrobial peptide transport system permease subunit
VVVAIGAAAGIAGGIAATRFFRTMLFGVSAADPLAIGMSILTLIFIAFAAAVLPARRATKVDPMIALRYE